MPTITSTKTVQLTAKDVVDALKSHFNMPPTATVRFTLGTVGDDDGPGFPSHEVTGAVITNEVREPAPATPRAAA